MAPKKYITVFLLLLFFSSGAIIVFNRIVDPFWFYRDISINGFNADKPEFRTFERHVKPSIVVRKQPETLIFGSSLSEVGFNPLHPALNQEGKSYNFALAGAGWDINQCNIKFALKHDLALKEIVLGIVSQVSVNVRDFNIEMITFFEFN